MNRLDEKGRSGRSIRAAFAISLLAHGLVLLAARDAARYVSFTWAVNSPPLSIEARLMAPQSRPIAPPTSPAGQAPASKKTASPSSRHSDNAAQFADALHSSSARLIALKTGKQLDPDDWHGAITLGQPFRIRLTINPAGFIENWELLTPNPVEFQLDLEAMNNMVRNMSADKTGETHVSIWQCQLGEKNGELLAVIYPTAEH